MTAATIPAPSLSIPASWHRYVLPRRGGPLGTCTPSSRVTVHGSAADLVPDELVEQVLRAEGTPSDLAAAGLAALAAGGDGDSVQAAAVVAAARVWLIDARRWIHPQDVATLVEAIGASWLRRHGPVFAAAACAALAGLRVQAGGPPSVRRAAASAGPVGSGRPRHLWVATPVRGALAMLADDEYAACIRALRPYRERSLSQRVAVAFLAPSQTQWHRDDTRAVVGASADSPGRSKNAAAMLSVVTDIDALAPLLAHTSGRDLQADPAPLYTAAATMGTAVVPVLSELADRVARGGGLGHLYRRLRMMTSALTGDGEPRAAMATRPDRSCDRVGRLAGTVAGGAVAEIGTPGTVWLPGERERWAGYQVRWPLSLCDHRFAALAEQIRKSQSRHERTPPRDRLTCLCEVDFFVHGPNALTRPLLPGWRPDARCAGVKDTWFHVLVARHELLALAPMLALARRRPATVGWALVPYRSAAVAALMTAWLGRDGKVGDVARAWFDRHERPAVATANGSSGSRRWTRGMLDPDAAYRSKTPVGGTRS